MLKPKIIRIKVVNQGEHSLDLKLTGGLLKLLGRLSSEEKNKFCDELGRAIKAKLDKDSDAK